LAESIGESADII